MNCLCCGKELKKDSKFEELSNQWHDSCIKKFFGTNKLPIIDISSNMLDKLAGKWIDQGYTVPGVQKKLSLHLSHEKGRPRLTLVDYPTGFIVKPQTENYPFLPESEYLAMSMARITGIKTVPFALLKTNENGFVYITKRIDRKINGNNLEQFAMEDFCQLDNRLTADKYKGSYERCAKVIMRYSDSDGLDLTELLLRLVFSFVIGNSDMHLKNFSLIETNPGSERYHLSEAYDMLPVNIIIPEDKEEFALTINGKKQNIRRKDFLVFAENSGINPKSAEKIIFKVISMKDNYLKFCNESYLPDNMKSQMMTMICKRIGVLSEQSGRKKENGVFRKP